MKSIRIELLEDTTEDKSTWCVYDHKTEKKKNIDDELVIKFFQVFHFDESYKSDHLTVWCMKEEIDLIKLTDSWRKLLIVEYLWSRDFIEDSFPLDLCTLRLKELQSRLNPKVNNTLVLDFVAKFSKENLDKINRFTWKDGTNGYVADACLHYTTKNYIKCLDSINIAKSSTIGRL